MQWVAVVIWVLLLIAFIVFEAVTVQLVSIWFIGGSLGAILTSLLGGSVLLQCIVFFGLSVTLLLVFRPIFKKRLTTPMIATNLDMVVGKSGIVVQRIDNDHGTGRVNVGGQQWTARSLDGSTIEEGAKIKAQEISGVKLIVSPE